LTSTHKVNTNGADVALSICIILQQACKLLITKGSSFATTILAISIKQGCEFGN